MPRRKLIKTSLNPYHVTIRSNNKEWFELPMELVWSYCKFSLAKANSDFPVKIQAFVLMQNHYHLMIWTPDANLDQFMKILNWELSKRIRFKTGRINRIFGDRYKWSLIKDEKYYLNVLKYIYQNPLRANLIDSCENYRFSSLYYYSRNFKFATDLFNPYYQDWDQFLMWINEDPNPEGDQA